MAEIICLGSDSSGNGYIIKTKKEYLFLECGVPAREFMKAIDHERSKVAGVLVSHIHGDHAKFVEIMSTKDINIYSNEDTISSKSIRGMRGRILTPRRWMNIGSFCVYPFFVPHDVDNFAYIIRHQEFGYLLFATDTYSIPYVFPNIDHYMIEANYDDEILNASSLDSRQRNRLMTSHMSVDYALQYLDECHAENAQNIILVHLSSRHSDADAFKHRMEQRFGVPCTIADKNVTINISKL